MPTSVDPTAETVETVETAVRELLRSRAPLRSPMELSADLPLGPGGLGLDSIALVELLLDGERRFGIPAMAMGLLDGAPLTVGRLVAGVLAHLAPPAPPESPGRQ
jgi:acyl carrier protein